MSKLKNPNYGFITQPPLGESVNHDLGIRHQRIPPLSNRFHPIGGTFGLTIQCSMMCTDMVRRATQAQNSVENKITVTPFVLKWLVTNE